MKKTFAAIALAVLSAAPAVVWGEEAAAPERKPLMAGLDQIGLADPLDKAGINVYGFVEGSWTQNLTSPSGGPNEGRSFDQYKNQGVFDQFDLTLERTVDVSKKEWDIGFRIETLWGSDASMVHSNGLFTYYDGTRDPQNQWDLNQAYVDLAIPVGNGLRVRAGKFVTLLGAETINPNGNWLFSRSYLFNYAIPFTHTGAIATYALDDQWTVEGGIFRGWDQSIDDNNDAPSYEGRVTWTSKDKKWMVSNNIVTGPEQADDSSDFRTVWDLVLCYTPDPNGPWTFMLNSDYAYESLPANQDTQWYGIAGYAGYKLNNTYTLNSRLEWFHDEDGTRIGLAGSYYEGTLGVSIHPFSSGLASNLIIRPEIRYDYSENAFFDGGNDHNQITAAVDMIFNF